MNLNGSTGETLTVNGNLNLAGGNSVYSLFGTSTSGLTNVLTNNALSITGTHEIDLYTPASGPGVLPAVAGQTYTYDLINYTGTLLTSSGGSGVVQNASASPFMIGGGELVLGPGSTPPGGANQLVIPPAYFYQFSNTTVGSVNEIQIALTVPAPLTWTGSVNNGTANTGNWDKQTTANWAASGLSTTYIDGETVTFADKNPLNSTNVANFIVNIVPASVSPGSVTFTNTGVANGGVDYTFNGGAIAGTTGIAMNGTGGVGGKVTFNQANSFGGAVAISQGELIVTNANGLGNTTGTSVASGAALELSGGITEASTGSNLLPLTLNGTGYPPLPGSPAGALDSEGGNNAYPGAITLGSATTINSGTAADALTLSGGITAQRRNDLSFTGAGSVSITKAITSTDTSATALNYTSAGGTGTLTLGVADTLAGQVNVNSGTVLMTNAVSAAAAVRRRSSFRPVVHWPSKVALRWRPPH